MVKEPGQDVRFGISLCDVGGLVLGGGSGPGSGFGARAGLRVPLWRFRAALLGRRGRRARGAFGSFLVSVLGGRGRAAVRFLTRAFLFRSAARAALGLHFGSALGARLALAGAGPAAGFLRARVRVGFARTRFAGGRFGAGLATRPGTGLVIGSGARAAPARTRPGGRRGGARQQVREMSIRVIKE